MQTKFELAPALQVSQWFNTTHPLSLASLRGRVVVLHAFQMLCPGCVSHGIPQAINMHNTFERDEVVVLGLHTVFEHHAVMTPQALKVFLHEYHIPFPVGVDMAGLGSAIPLTMQDYRLQGTPSMVVIDRKGFIRLNYFGRLDDLTAGALLGQLIADPMDADRPTAPDLPVQSGQPPQSASSCDNGHCTIASQNG